MEKKVMSKEFMLNNRETILEKHLTFRRKNNKAPLLTKKERKTLGIGKDRAEASVKNVRIAPRKVNVVIRTIKGRDLREALAILRYTPKAASPILFKLLESAAANAVNNNELNRDSLYVADCYVNQGPVLKRIIPRARGSASRIHKRTSHITVVLTERK